MSGNHHVRFLGEEAAATPPPYPTHERGGASHDGEAEHLQGVNQKGVMGAYADEVMGLDAAAGVEEEDGKAFAFGVEGFGCGNVQAPISGGGFGGVAKGHLVGGAGLAEGNYFVNVGRGGEAEGFDDFVQTRQRRLEARVTRFRATLMTGSV